MTDSSPWAALAEPFPESEVKQRPGSALWDHKPNCQGPKCRDTRDPNAHRQFSYVDARAVMQRLDDVLTPSGWDFTSTVIPGTDIVRGELTIAGVTRVDYGYPNSDHDEEPIKAASSDALKRAAVMFGIGRHLYSDNTQSGGRAASPPARPSARPTVVREDGPEFAPNEWDEASQSYVGVPFAAIGDNVPQPGDMCEEHFTEWRGEVGDLFHGPKPYHRHESNIRKARGA